MFNFLIGLTMLGATALPTGCTQDKVERAGYSRIAVNCVNPSGPVVVRNTVTSNTGSAVSIVSVVVRSSGVVIRR